jgi:hypothetical protein
MWQAPNWLFFRSFGLNSLVELSNILCMYVGSTKCLGPPNWKSGILYTKIALLRGKSVTHLLGQILVWSGDPLVIYKRE